MPSDIFHAAADGVNFVNPAALFAPGNVGRAPSLKSMDVAKIRTWIERGGDVRLRGSPGLGEDRGGPAAPSGVLAGDHRTRAVVGRPPYVRASLPMLAIRAIQEPMTPTPIHLVLHP